MMTMMLRNDYYCSESEQLKRERERQRHRCDDELNSSLESECGKTEDFDKVVCVDIMTTMQMVADE